MIRLTIGNGRGVSWINPHYIVSISAVRPAHELGPQSVLKMHDGSFLEFDQTPEVVLYKIANVK